MNNININELSTELQCQLLSKSYDSHNGSISALHDVSFSVFKQEFVSIVGPSGCGKTTLLKLIARLSTPTSGQVIFEDVQNNGRLHSAMVFQEHGLMPWLTTIDNVAFGLEMQGMGKSERQDRARILIEQVGLTDFTFNYPHQLSVGMRQRAAIARAFVSDPQILLMDEPFSSLDAQNKLVLREELLGIWRTHRKTVLYVTHDIEEAILMSDRILVMSGRPGSIQDAFAVPLNRPRNMLDGASDEVMNMKLKIWKMLESEVRQRPY
jgi:NitT/TauT family transport system ATP-binding protein